MFGGFNDDDMSYGISIGGMHLFGNRHSHFEENLKVYSVRSLANSREFANFGGKIFLPPSALVKLSNLNISYPMLFELKNNDTFTHAGVLEFIAEEGRVYMPEWMMESIQVQEGSIIKVLNCSLPLGTFVKIQPQSCNFLDITDPKAVLENAFRNFSCLTKDEIITINYNDTLYDILVMEIKPEGKGISIIETDLEVDFAEPLGYVEPERPASVMSKPSTSKIESLEKQDTKSWKAFSGAGNAVSRKKKNIPIEISDDDESVNNVILPLKLPKNNLFFGYRYIPPPGHPDHDQEQQEIEEVKKGYTLRGN